MRRWLLVLVLVLVLLAVAAPTRANRPDPVLLSKQWARLVQAAEAELEKCRKRGGTTFGDVEIAYNVDRDRWTASSSKSLGILGPEIAGCAQRALANHLPLIYDDNDVSPRKLEESLTIGDPVPVLPPAATLLPVWRRAKTTASAVSELKKLLPPDYELTKDLCLDTNRGAIQTAQFLWLSGTGAWIPKIWQKELSALLGVPGVSNLVWSAPGDVVGQRENALCLMKVEAATQAAMRAHMDNVASCWAGGFEDVLLHPRIEFPTSEQYRSVATHGDRSCAMTTSGEFVCCGANEPLLPPAPSRLESVALGYRYACGLDAHGAAVCWGDIASPSTGPFVKLTATSNSVCGVREDGTLACWGRLSFPDPPAAIAEDDYSDIATACALRKDGTVACWGDQTRAGYPSGQFTSLVSDWTRTCGLRRDGTVGCWESDADPVDTPLPDRFVEIALTNCNLCGRHADGTVRTPGLTRTPSVIAGVGRPSLPIPLN